MEPPELMLKTDVHYCKKVLDAEFETFVSLVQAKFPYYVRYVMVISHILVLKLLKSIQTSRPSIVRNVFSIVP